MNRWLVRWRQPAAPRVRMFCFSYAGGGASVYRSWPESLPGWVDVCAVQLPGRESRLSEPPYGDMDALVGPLADALDASLDLPYVTFGHSLGALVSFELARHLRRTGRPLPRHMFVSGRRAPQLVDRDWPIHRLPTPELLAAIQHLNGTPPEVFAHPELVELAVPLLRADFAISETYRYRPEPPLSVPMTAFGGWADGGVTHDDLNDWAVQVDGPFRQRMLPGDHFFLRPQAAQVHAEVLADLTGLIEPDGPTVTPATGNPTGKANVMAVPPRTATDVEDRYRPVLRNQRHGRVLSDIYQRAYGTQHPGELDPFGFVTWPELRHLAARLHLAKGDLLVDVGCGRGGPGMWLAQETGADLVGLDVVAEAVTEARGRVDEFGLADRARFAVASATGTGLDAGTADGVVSVDALWMVRDKAAAFGELARILRPGGRLAVSTWQPEYLDHRWLLTAAGFTEVEITEPDGWRERQATAYEQIIARHTELAAELGGEAADVLVAEARDTLPTLGSTRRLLISASRG
ncbi:thioesterase domain-containing protein [Jidongwangia harbinensis]|uniref:thioesterase domain-containing protein n=1 Tax=Jidongwangia harbinensis TaxID=2878561 RepID=UPI001CD9E811|nr:thioesterase domain-containing protein [Jidongwangia harbinensis]MCA2218370.1 methyltransferase domain-containing protein [Jidongwangia harbinensis]